MGIRHYRPTSPGRRGMTVYTFEELTKTEPEKSLVEPLKSKAGRNNLGRVTIRFRGGGHKRLYRIIDFRRNKDGVPGKVAAIEYDPNRTARIALIHYADGEKRYILAPEGLRIGDTVMSGPSADIRAGNALPLENIPVGTVVHNVELKPGKGGQIARSAGSSVQILGREGEYVILRLTSGETRKVHKKCRATVGQVGNVEHELLVIGKAGRSRWLGRRPHVRGTAMNPVDHPHGGGEGRSPIGMPSPKSPWGKPTLGKKTRNPRKNSSRFILERRKRKKR